MKKIKKIPFLPPPKKKTKLTNKNTKKKERNKAKFVIKQVGVLLKPNVKFEVPVRGRFKKSRTRVSVTNLTNLNKFGLNLTTN